MTYTEKELNQFLHGISLSLLSKESAQHWRYDEETAKEIEWLEALERKVRADKADRKTENSSEKPNNCEELNAYRECVKSRSFWDSKHCDGCYFDERCPFDEPKDEPQTNADQHVQHVESVEPMQTEREGE